MADIKQIQVGGSTFDINDATARAGLTSKENSSNKVSAWQTTTDNTHYPSEKLVKDNLDLKYDASNPSGYQTSSQVDTKIAAAIGNAISASY